MTNSNESKKPEQVRGTDRFRQKGIPEQISSREERQVRLNSLPDGERELAEETARFADLCQYLSAQSGDIPADIVAELGSLAAFLVGERTTRLKALNERLMKHIHDTTEDSGRAQ